MIGSFSAPDRRVFLIGASSFALCACGSLLQGPPPSQIYMLRPQLSSPATGEKVSWALAIVKPDASGSLDTDRIALARGNTQLDYYANAVWPDSLPDVIETSLLAEFQASGRIDAVARDEDALNADYLLSTDIRDFEARYETPDAAPAVTVTLIVQMADARSRKIVGSLAVGYTEPASANSVDQVVEAFDRALAKAIAQIMAWTLNFPPPSALAAGRSAP